MPHLNEIQKVYKLRVTQPLSFADIDIFSPEARHVCYIRKYRQKHFEHFDVFFPDSFDIYWVFIDCFNQHVFNFDDVSKTVYSILP